MNVDRNQLNTFLEAKEKIFAEGEKFLSDFYNTVITLFISLFSGLFFFGTGLSDITRLQSVLLLICLGAYLTIVILSVSGKFLKHVQINQIKKNLNLDMDKFLINSNTLLSARSSKIVLLILDIIPWLIYLIAVLGLTTLFLLGYSIIL